MSKLLGDVSAYAYAVSQGYTGTEEQFAADMARIATTASEAAASADAAAESASDAATEANTAKTQAEAAAASANAASGSATLAAQQAGIAQASANEASQYMRNAESYAGAAQEAADEAETTIETVRGYASDASASKSAAATSASNAAASATAAQTAKTAAETAQGRAEQAAQSVSESAAQIAKNTDNFASEFSTSTTYAIGDYCIHEGSLYRFINEHTGAWSASDVEATNVGGEIGDVKSAVEQNRVTDIPLIEKKLSHVQTANVFDKTSVVSGYLDSNGDVGARDGFSTSGFIPVNVGDVIKTYYIANSSVYAANMSAVCGYNANKEFVSGTRSTSVNTLTIPDGVSYIRFSVGNGMVDTYMMIVNGSQPTAYIPYENHYVATKDFIDSAIRTYGFAEIPIAKDETDFWDVERSQNLFDKTDVESGEYYNTNGSIGTTTNVFRSLVELDGAGTYSFNVMGNFFGLANAVKIPLFDKNKSYLKTITGSTEETTPTDKNLMTLVVSQQDIDDGVAYIGYSEHPDNLNDLMVVKSSSYPSSYIPYYKRWTLPDLELTEENAGELPTNPLYGKTVVFDGDSICAGNDSALDGYGNGWAARIGKDNGMDWHNTGVGGGTITSGLYFSGGSARHWVSTYIDTIHANYHDLDYLILEGGTNDADILFGQTAKIGEIDETDYNRDNVADHFDDETYCGALDTLFYKAQQYYPKKKIGFIIAQKMGRALNADGNPDPYVANRRHFFDLAIQACEKWGIPYIDLWNEGYLNPNSTAMYDPQYNTVQTATEHGLCYIDGQHLTAYGYNVISPKIAAWMKTL